MIASEIRRRLEARGIELHAPATAASIDNLSNFIDNRIDEYFLAILQEFDGFASHDGDPFTMYRMWPISEIIDFSPNNLDNKPKLAIGDELIMADLMMFDVSMGGEVSFLESEYYLADNIFDFYIRLGDGHFDRRKAVS